MPIKKIDQDKSDEQRITDEEAQSGMEVMPPRIPDEEAPTTPDAPTTKAQRVSSRIKGAYQLGGVWYAADGSPLTDPECRLAHQAADRAAAEARRKALLGGGE